MAGDAGGGSFHDPEQPKDGPKGSMQTGDGKSFGMAYKPVKKRAKKRTKKRKVAKSSSTF